MNRVILSTLVAFFGILISEATYAREIKIVYFRDNVSPTYLFGTHIHTRGPLFYKQDNGVTKQDITLHVAASSNQFLDFRNCVTNSSASETVVILNAGDDLKLQSVTCGPLSPPVTYSSQQLMFSLSNSVILSQDAINRQTQASAKFACMRLNSTFDRLLSYEQPQLTKVGTMSSVYSVVASFSCRPF